MPKPLIFLFLLALPYILYSQEKEGKAPSAIFVDLAYTFQMPEGNMKENFGLNSSIGSRISFLSPNNWIFAINGEWIFSDEIKTDVLALLRSPNGNLIERTGRMGLTQLGERGFHFSAQIGKLIPFKKGKRDHCLEIRLGAGYLQHWIRIRLLGYPEDLPQLNGDYLKGYDRMTSGPALSQYIGYRFLSKYKLINLFIGLDFIEGFTYNRRYWNFDTLQADTQLKFDILLGVRAGFCIPFYIMGKNTRTEDLKFY